ncbi:hypothetical protein [Limosilactobacillus reuteri]|uniref:hypothetical protein n=1 Tax=Limosilactobacillus reuteri TaxID=1598 RepID=UPI00159F2F20|nr:hypothetical protein [Limosilactobacillus reuteri]
MKKKRWRWGEKNKKTTKNVGVMIVICVRGCCGQGEKNFEKKKLGNKKKVVVEKKKEKTPPKKMGEYTPTYFF